MTVTIRPVFEEDGKLYLQVFLDDTLHEFKYIKKANCKQCIKTLEYDRIDISEGIVFNKTSLSK